MNHITLFESFGREEDATISEDAYTKEREIVKGIVKTWVNDYVIPMVDFQTWPPSQNTAEKDPKFKAFVSKAKAWLGKDSGIPKKSFLSDEIVGTYSNSAIVYHNLYQPKEISHFKENKGKYPITASFYDALQLGPK